MNGGLSVGVFGGGATVVCGAHSEDQGSVDHVRSEEGDPRHERHRDAGKNSVYSLHPSRTQAFLRDKRSPEARARNLPLGVLALLVFLIHKAAPFSSLVPRF